MKMEQLQVRECEVILRASRQFRSQQAQRVKDLPVKDKRKLLQVTRYGSESAARSESFPRGVDNLNVFFPHYGLFGADVLCHHILKLKDHDVNEINVPK
jgi:hypothetical protein